MLSYLRNTLIILAILFSCKETAAQRWAFENMRVEQGLPASETYNMFQDSRGYLFVATEYGLVKYNGNRFVPVCTNIPIRERIAYAFHKNKAGICYFVNSQFHIYYIRNDSAIRLKKGGVEIPTIPHSYPIKQIFEDDSDNIYVSSLYNNFIFDIASKQWATFKLTQQDSETIVVEKLKDDYAAKFNIVKSDKIIVRNGPYKGSYLLNNSDAIISPVTVTEAGDALYFIAGTKTIRIDRQKQISTYHTKDNIISLKVSANKHVWIGTLHSGLLELDNEFKLLGSYLENYSIADVLFDNQDGVWVTTLEQGIFHCPNKHEYHYDNIHELSGEISVLKNFGNHLFIGTSNSRLLHMTNKFNKIINFEKGKIQDIIEWQGRHLVSNTYSVFSLSGTHKISEVIPSLTSYFMLSQSDRFLCATPSVLTFFSKNYNEIRTIPIEAKVKSLLAVGEDSILVGTTKGILLLNASTFIKPKVFESLQNTSISDLEYEKGNIWIGTKGDGLFLLSQNKHFAHLPAPSEIITNITFYKDSFLLLSTNTGLYIKSKTNSATNWTTLYTGEVLNATPFRDKIFVGTKHGLIAIDTSHLFVQQAYPVYLSSVTAGKRNVSIDSLIFNHQEKDLYFNFDLLSYGRQNSKLSYRLVGAISSKGQISGRQLFLQNLEPGNYNLLLYVGDLDGKLALIVPFQIKPAFWQTMWFIFLLITFCIIIILASAYSFYKYTKRTAYKKAAIRRTLSEYKLTALKAQINPHFISNSLTSIQQLVLSNELDNASRYLAQFSQLIRQVLQYSDKSLVLLSEELKIIDLNISLEQLRFNNKFSYIVEIDPDVSHSAVYIPPLISQPFIENAIWHGLLPLRGVRMPLLRIKIVRDGDNLILSIIDNGVGRKANSNQKSVSNSAFASRGIELTQSRIENLNQIYTTGKATIIFIDLQENEEPSGTRVDIVLPYLTHTNYDNNYKKHNS